MCVWIFLFGISLWHEVNDNEVLYDGVRIIQFCRKIIQNIQSLSPS